MERPDAWWQQRGPFQFVVDIAAAIRTVPVVGVSVPQKALPDHLMHIEKIIDGIEGHLHWVDVDIGHVSEITTAIARQVLPRGKALAVRRPSDLVGLRELAREVVVVNATDIEAKFHELVSFVASFAAAAQRNPTAPRPAILLDLPTNRAGTRELAAMGKDRIRIIRWRGYVNHHDMIPYVSHLMVGRFDSPLTNTLLTTIIAYVAGWDPLIATFLSNKTDEEILDAWSTLDDIASQLRFSECCWEKGTLDEISGRSVPHILWLVRHGHTEEFDRILWIAHLHEIFPWLEECRLNFVDLYKGHWKLPVIKEHGPDIYDAADLELGEMFYNLTKTAGFPRENYRFLETCTEARHDLAHRRPISPVRIARLSQLSRSLSV